MKEEDVKDEDLEASDEGTEDPVEDTDHGDSEETTEEEKDSYKEKYENLRSALKETRGKSKATIDAMRRRMSLYEEKLEGLEKKSETSELSMLDDYGDEDLVTVAAFKGILGARQKKYDAELEQLRTASNSVVLQIAEDSFAETHDDYSETVEPFRDLLTDPEFAKGILSNGLAKAPRKFYDHCKKQLGPEDNESNNEGTSSEKKKPLNKPKTMDKKSHSSKDGDGSNGPMTLEQKRKKMLSGKLTPDELDEMWEKSFKS